VNALGDTPDVDADRRACAGPCRRVWCASRWRASL